MILQVIFEILKAVSSSPKGDLMERDSI